MEEQHSNLLRQYRSKFVQSVEVDRLYPMLVKTKVLSVAETSIIDQLPSQQERVGRLLDILPTKGRLAFESFCLALETTYPHLLTVMFLGSTSIIQLQHKGSSQSTVSSSTSESDMEDSRGVSRLSLQDARSMEGGRSDVSLTGIESGDHRERNYKELQDLCKNSMQQVEELNKEYSEAVKRTERALKEAECFRNELHSANMSEHQLRGELEETKRELHQAVSERDCLRGEVEDLQQMHKEDSEELKKLWHQNKEFMRQPNSSDILQKMYDTAHEKIKDLTENLQTLKIRYDQLASDRKGLVSKTERYEEEMSSLQLQMETQRKEKANIHGQFVSCQQKYMTVMRDYKMIQKERDEALKRVQILQQEQSDILADYNQMRAHKKDLENKLKWTEEQRRAVVDEYSTVMGERDVVHKEIDKLQNDLQLEEQKRREAEKVIQMLRQELDLQTHRLNDSRQEHDLALRDMDSLSERYQDMLNNTMMAEQERDTALKDFEKFKEQRDVARQERTEALAQRDMLLLKYYDAEKQQKTISDERNMANRDVEQMRRQLDSLQRDLKEALQETVKAKHMRDWAFKERDKVVQERESIRTLSDQMRKERDLTVNKLAESLRKVDDMENQRNKSVKDLQEIRDKMQTQSEREARMRQLIAQHSRDSAIDADSLEWETENVELDPLQLLNENVDISNAGFDIAECPDHMFFPEDCSIFVTKVEKGSPAHGKLRVNDCLVRVNDIDLSSATKQGAVQALTNSSQGVLHLVVKRRRSHACKLVPLKLDNSRGNPLVLENGVFVSRVSSGSQSLRELGVVPGDRIVMVNNTPMENKSVREVESLLESCQNPVNVTVMRLSIASMSAIPTSISPTVDSFRSQDVSSCRSSMSALLSTGENSEGENRGETASHKEMGVLLNGATEPVMVKVSREASFRSAHSREGSHESNATQGTLKAADWEEMKNQQYQSMTGHVDPSSEDRSPWEKGADFENTVSAGQNASPVENYSHMKQASGDSGLVDKRSERVSLPQGMRQSSDQQKLQQNQSGDTSMGHDRDINFSAFPPDYSRTVTQRRGGKKYSLEKIDYNSTWPKSRGPPEMYITQMGKRNRDTTIPLVSPPSHAPVHKETAVPPKPPSRNSSFHAPLKHQHSSSGSSIHSDSRRNNQASSQQSVGGSVQTPTSVTVSPVAIVRNHPGSGMEEWLTRNAYHNGTEGGTIVTSSKVVKTRKCRGPGSPLTSPPSNRPMSMPPDFDKNYNFVSNSRGKYHREDGYFPPKSSPTQRKNLRPPALHFPSMSNPVSPDSFFPPGNKRNTLSAPAQTHYVVDKHNVPSYIANSKAMNSYPTVVDGLGPYRNFYTMPTTPSRVKQNMGNSITSLPGRRRGSHQSDSSSDFTNPKGESRISLPPGDFDYYSLPFHAIKSKRIHIPGPPSSPNSSTSLDKASSLNSGRSSPTSPSIPENTSESSHSGLALNVPETGVVVTPQGSGQNDVRLIEIQKSNEQLGFAIMEGVKEGIFVRSVTPNSLASESKMCYGDQILEFNGINLRQATKSQAASIMSQGGNAVNILVQYNPDKINDQSNSTDGDSISRGSTRSGSLGPSSPIPSSKRPQSDLISVDGTITPPTPRASRFYENLPNDDMHGGEVRQIYLKNNNSRLGVIVSGGNAVGIFVSEILPDGLAARHNGLRRGDQILEYNDMSFKMMTAEQATLELQKPSEYFRLIVQYNITKYNSVQGLNGDAVYIRALVDFTGKLEEQLSFKKDDILFVSNTLYNNDLGMWGAHHVDDYGKKTISGCIPSKSSLAMQLFLRPSVSEERLEESVRSSRKTSLGKRGSSFFRRRKAARSNSKDSRDFSEGSISDVPIHDEADIPTYQRVERLDIRIKRPVVLLGPHTDKVASKLVDESPDKFSRVPESKRASVQDLDRDMAGNIFLDGQQPEGFYECIPTQAIKDICEGGSHCILDGVSPAICKRLNKSNLYPIIIFMKFKNIKQIREQKDPHFLREKVNNKQAKDMFERAHQIEQEFRSMFTGISAESLVAVEAVNKETIAGGNLASMCTRLKEIIDREQKKVTWIPSSLPL